MLNQSQMLGMVPGSWSDPSSVSDHESVESEDIHDDRVEAKYPEADLTLISELLENVERNPPAQEARTLLMQHYAICGWHDAAEEEAHLILNIDSCVKEAQIYLKDTRKVNFRGARELGIGN